MGAHRGHLLFGQALGDSITSPIPSDASPIYLCGKYMGPSCRGHPRGRTHSAGGSAALKKFMHDAFEEDIRPKGTCDGCLFVLPLRQCMACTFTALLYRWYSLVGSSWSMLFHGCGIGIISDISLVHSLPNSAMSGSRIGLRRAKEVKPCIVHIWNTVSNQ